MNASEQTPCNNGFGSGCNVDVLPSRLDSLPSQFVSPKGRRCETQGVAADNGHLVSSCSISVLRSSNEVVPSFLFSSI